MIEHNRPFWPHRFLSFNISCYNFFMSDPQSHFIQPIHEHCPDLTIEQAEANTTGQYNHVLTVNGAWIFRFPRYAADIDRLAWEVRLLERLPLLPRQILKNHHFSI